MEQRKGGGHVRCFSIWVGRHRRDEKREGVGEGGKIVYMYSYIFWRGEEESRGTTGRASVV